MPDRPWNDEYTLLCEKCGYVIEGLDTEGNCPECGKPIAESLPERRVGTPWQQSPGAGSLVRTWWMTLRHPLRTLDLIKFDEHHQPLLTQAMHFSAGISAIAWGWSWFAMLLIQPSGKTSLDVDIMQWLFTGVFGGLIVFILIGGCVWLLTTTESKGLRIISATRRFRIDRSIAFGTCAHGAVGWVLGALLGSMTITIITLIHSAFEVSPTIWIYLLPFVLAIPGFLFFETFAYLGLRRCKYANRVRQDAS